MIYDTKYGEQQATVWVATLSYDSLSQAREIMLYGEVAMPISSQDVGVEEFDGRYYLPFETNSVRHNEYVRSRLLWSEEDPKGTYDKTVFSSDGPIRGVRGTSVALTLGGVESTVSVPQETAVTDTHELEEAMTEHWSTYSAAVDAGMLLDETTKQTYLSQDAAARALVTRARAGGADAPTNADIQAARTSLNTAFDALTPAPYDRTSLTTSLAGATTLLEANGKDGRRLTRASYDTLVAAVATGQKLLATPDAVTLKAPREGELVTHRDFDNAVAALPRYAGAGVPCCCTPPVCRTPPGAWSRRTAVELRTTCSPRRDIVRTSRVTRRGLLALAAAGGLALAAGCKPLSLKWRGSESKKPVLYLYPQQETALEVSLAWDGELTYAYPEPVRTRGLATWSVTASPDGTLRDSAGRTYPSLFWEGTSSPAFTQAEGFVVEPGGETVFLEEKLALLGLSERESADFITYWGPRMRTRGRCLVTFATDQYARRARYTFVGDGAAMVPDTFVRVYVVIGAVPREDVPEQVLTPAPTRHGFTAVEWGGTEQ